MPDTDPIPALIVRPASSRGQTRLGWLDSRHSFSFGEYRDIHHMGFHALRVINDDRIAPGGGFGEHPHRDMEIITWVLDGALKHADSLGHEFVLKPNELQGMTAGRGIYHSEFNASLTAPVHLLQIWIRPRERGLAPAYDQRAFDPDSFRNRFRTVASPDGADDSLVIQQDALVSVGRFDALHRVRLEVPVGRAVWFQVARGALAIDDESLAEGDGAAVNGAAALTLTMREETELLMFDLAADDPPRQS